MTDEELQLETQRLALEREKLIKQLALEERRERRLEQQSNRGDWHNPLFLAIVAAVIGLLSNALVAYVNGISQRDLEDRKAESTRILQVLKTGDPDQAAENLQLLVDAGLIKNGADKIKDYLKSREPGEGASLPVKLSDSLSQGALPPFATSTSSKYCSEYLSFGNPTPKNSVYCRLGYAFGFNEKTKLADWVAYRISKERTNQNIPRTSKWYLDPEIPSTSQVTNDAYRNNEWDRGNLIRRTDATWDVGAHKEVWFYSITAPQHTWLNRNLWLSLEKLTTSAVSNSLVDDLLIISGPIYGEKTIRNYRGLVDIPDKYYRIAYDHKNKRVAAWVVPNNESSKELQRGVIPDTYQSTIDSIEEMTGHNFFSLLPKELQDRLESKVGDVSWLGKQL